MSAPAAAARTWRAAWAADLAVVAVLVLTSLVGLVRVFGGWWFAPAALAGLVLGLGVAAVGARRRWAALTVAGATVLAYLLVAGPLAFRSTTIAGVLPSLATLHDLVLGSVQVWKGFVTAPIPVVAFPQLVAVPFLAALVTAVLAGSLALRVRRPGWALLPAAALLVGAILLSTAQATWPVVQGGAFAVVSVGWLAWRRVRAAQPGVQADPLTQTVEDRDDLGRLRRRRLLGAGAMAVVVAGLVGLVGPAVAGEPARYVLRDRVEPPLDLHDYASPLESFRRLVKDQADDVLFTVSGLAPGQRLRLAVLEDYTGQVMDVAGGDRSGSGTSGSFEIAGSALSGAGARDRSDGGSDADLTVEVGEYRGIWVPGVGLPTAVRFGGDRAATLDGSLYVNDTTGTMVDPEGLRPGDTYTLRAQVPAVVGLEALGSAELVRSAASGEYRLEASAQAARTFVGTQSRAVGQVRLIRDRLIAGGVFSDGLDGQAPSPAGHGAWRIGQLLAEDRYVGDDEQFAVAAALMIRSLGYEARVVMGFVPEAGASVTSWAVRGTDVHAWVEVRAEDAGWVPVDVTPDENQAPQQDDPRSNRAPQTTVIQDPPTPEEPALVPQPPLAQEQDADKKDAGQGLGAYLAIAAAVGVPLLLLVTPLVLVVVLKGRRRRRRFRAPNAAARVSGGWYEVTDAVVDLGARVPDGATRLETAVGLRGDFGGPRMLAVAQRADRVVFGDGEPTAQEVERFWTEVDALLGEVRSGAGWWRRLRARFSVRSLRRGQGGGRRRTWPWRTGEGAR